MEKEADSFIDIIVNHGNIKNSWCVYLIVFRQKECKGTEAMGYFYLLNIFDEEAKALDYVKKMMESNPVSRFIIRSSNEPVSIVKEYTKDNCVSLSKEEWKKVRLMSEQEIKNRKTETNKKKKVEESISKERETQDDPESIEYLRTNFSSAVLLHALIESKKEGLIKAEQSFEERKANCRNFLQNKEDKQKESKEENIKKLKQLYEERLPERGEEEQMKRFLNFLGDVGEAGIPRILESNSNNDNKFT
jgi:hypothetical protein